MELLTSLASDNLAFLRRNLKYPSLLCLLIAVFTALQGLYWFSPFSFNRSEGTYWQTLLQLQAGHQLYREVFYSQLPLFIKFAQLGQNFYGARILVSLVAASALLAMFILAQKVGGNLCALLSALLLGLDSTFFHLSHQLTGEVPGLAFLLWGLVALVLIPSPLIGVLVTAALLTLAIQIKVLMVVPVFGVLILLFFNKRKNAWPLGFLTCALNALLLLSFGFFTSGGLGQLQGGYWALFTNFSQVPVAANLHRLLTFRDYSMAAVLIAFPAILLSVLLLVKTSHKKIALQLLAGAVFFATILLLYVKVNTDHVILFSALSAFGVSYAVTHTSKRILGTALIVLALLGFAAIDVIESHQPGTRRLKQMQNARQALMDLKPENSFVVGDESFLISSAGRLSPPAFTDFSRARLETRSITCDSLRDSLAKPTVVAFVFSKNLAATMDCGELNYEAFVRSYFPQTIYRDRRVLIFAKDQPQRSNSQ